MSEVTKNPVTYKEFSARFDSTCSMCGRTISKGDNVFGSKHTDATGKSKWDIICEDCMKDVVEEFATKYSNPLDVVEVVINENSEKQDSDIKGSEPQDIKEMPYKKFIEFIKQNARFRLC